MPDSDTPVQAEGGEGLIRQVLEARTRLGPAATPEVVVDDLRGRGLTGVTVEEVRDVWDEGHLPGDCSARSRSREHGNAPRRGTIVALPHRCGHEEQAMGGNENAARTAEASPSRRRPTSGGPTTVGTSQTLKPTARGRTVTELPGWQSDSPLPSDLLAGG